MDGGANRRWGRHQRPIIAGGGHAAENKAEVSRREEGEEISRRRIIFNPPTRRHPDIIRSFPEIGETDSLWKIPGEIMG